MLKIDKRASGIYRIRGTYHGVTVDRSAKTRIYEEAKAIRDRWQREIYEREVLAVAPVQTFAELAVDYLKAGRDLGPYAEEIIIELAHMKLDKITPAVCGQIAAKVHSGSKPATINRTIIAPISAIMNWAADQGRVPARKWPRLRERQARTDWRRPGEIDAIMSALPNPQVRALVSLYVGCGLRASEAVFLSGTDIAPDLSSLRVAGTADPADAGARHKGYEGTKGFYDRTVRIPPRAKMFLAPVVNLGRGRALVNSRGQPWADRNAANKTLPRACERVQAAPLRAHALRHTWATWHYAVHRNLLELMSEGGWTDLSLVQRYAHLTDAALPREVIDAGWAISGQSEDGKTEKGNGNNAQAV